MKRIFLLLVLLLTLFGLPGCTEGPAPLDPPPEQTEGESPAGQAGTGEKTPEAPNEAEAVFAAKIVALEEGTALLAKTGPEAGAADLARISLEGLTLLDADKNPLSQADLQAGQLVEVGYNGLQMETYPLQLGEPVFLKETAREADLVGFYLRALQDIYDTDAGLNDGISVLAFDLEQAGSMTESEKGALVWLAGEQFGLETVTGTFEELCEAGYIDKEHLLFESGMLLTIQDGPMEEDTLSFDLEKWRSGTGAYYFMDCEAVWSGGGWTYTVGSEAIS